MSKKISFCSMMAVLGILCVFATVVFTSNTVFLFLLSTLFTYISAQEYGIKWSLLTYAVIASFSLVFLPDKLTALFYTVFVGCYPVFKCFTERISCRGVLKNVLKIFFALVCGGVAYLVFGAFFAVKIPLPCLFVIGIAVFALYDVALTYGLRFYAFKLRKYRKNF